MNLRDIWSAAAAVVAALGSGGIIVAALSSWLGKVWAERLMVKERSKHDHELAELRAKLEKANEESLSKLRTDLEIYRDTYLKAHSDKIGTYGFVFQIVSDFLADRDMIRLGQTPEGNVLERFNRGRLKAHGYLAMLAPQRVMDAYDSLVDYIFSTSEKTPPNDPHAVWKEIRRLVYVLINEIRDDVGIDKSKIVYHGER